MRQVKMGGWYFYIEKPIYKVTWLHRSHLMSSTNRLGTVRAWVGAKLDRKAGGSGVLCKLSLV